MKTLIKLTFMYLCLFIMSTNIFGQSEKELPNSTIHFIRSGNPFTANCMINLTLPNQRQFSIGNGSIVTYKIYSEGEINISLESLCASNGSVSNYTKQVSLNVKRGSDYYVTCGFSSIKEVEKKDVDKIISKCKNVLKQEENIESPIIPSSIANILKKKGKIQGTCFLISSEGYLITSFHCIENATEINVKGINGDFTTKYEAVVTASDPSNDLALLKLSNKNLKFNNPPFSIRSNGIAQAEKVYALGFPIAEAMGSEMKITEGIISAKSGVRGDMSKFQISAAVNPGNSGGPLIDEQGNLIGVIYAKLSDAESAGYAVKGSYLETFLKNIDGFTIPSLNNILKEKSLPEKIAALKPIIFILEAN